MGPWNRDRRQRRRRTPPQQQPSQNPVEWLLWHYLQLRVPVLSHPSQFFSASPAAQTTRSSHPGWCRSGRTPNADHPRLQLSTPTPFSSSPAFSLPSAATLFQRPLPSLSHLLPSFNRPLQRLLPAQFNIYRCFLGVYIYHSAGLVPNSSAIFCHRIFLPLVDLPDRFSPSIPAIPIASSCHCRSSSSSSSYLVMASEFAIRIFFWVWTLKWDSCNTTEFWEI